MRVIFMGTPDFAVGTLQAIKEAGHEIAAVVTQPDKPVGRGKELRMPPVKEKALEYGLKVYQPEKVRVPEFVEVLRDLKPDVIVVVAFGQLLPESILTLPKFGCVNVHASLLPRYRGAAPIQWAVINGDEETGVTTMQMDKGLDTGDILMVKKYRLLPEETGGSLFDRLSILGAELLTDTLKGLEEGTVTGVKQQGESDYAPKLDKTTGKIDFTQPAAVIERLIRGLNPWPTAYTFYKGKSLKLWSAELADTPATDIKPGCIYEVTKDSFTVMCGDGGLVIKELQLEGKKRMDTASFLRGMRIAEGEFLGDRETD